MTKDKIEQPTMSPAEFRRAQDRLGLTDFELARMLGYVQAQHIRRLRAAPSRGHHKPISGTAVRLLLAYLAGYRPDDWPADV